MDEVGEVVGLEVWDVVGDDDVGVELEEDPVYSFNTLLNSVDVEELVGVDVGVELEEVFNTLLNSVDVEELVDGEGVGVELLGVDVGDDGVEDEGVLVGGEEDGVGTGDEVGDVVELFCELGCELADEDGAELDGVDVGVLVDDVEEEVELCELALWLLGVDVEELVDGEDVGVELVGVDVGDDGVEDEGVLVDGEEDGVGTGDEVGDVAELFCGLGCELADEDGVELDGVDVGVLVDDVEEGVELCELALSMVFIASLRNCV